MTSVPFSEDLRYLYNLTPDSIVLDCGGYEGNWAKHIAARYGCRVHVFEPIPTFFRQCLAALRDSPTVTVHNMGVGNRTAIIPMHVNGDSSGAYAYQGELVDVSIQPLHIIFNNYGIGAADLVKLNIEGGEFDVLEDIIANGLIKRIRDIQVQWHAVVPDAEKRFAKLQQALAKTHELNRDSGWVWQNWSLKWQ